MHYQQPETYQHVAFDSSDFPVNFYNIKDATTMPHWHNHYEIVYGEKGVSTIRIDGTRYICQSGDILFIPANSLHSIIPNGPAVYNAIVIGDNLLDELLKQTGSLWREHGLRETLALPPLHLTNQKEGHLQVISGVRDLASQLKSEDEIHPDLIQLEILRLFAYMAMVQRDHLAKTPDASTPSNQAALIKDVIGYLEDNYGERITIKDISHQVLISEQHFSRLFKAYTGRTFVEYLTLFRLEKANKLLLKTDLPITRIPELTGFCNPNYFSRIYSKHFGFPPSKARKLMKDNVSL